MGQARREFLKSGIAGGAAALGVSNMSRADSPGTRGVDNGDFRTHLLNGLGGAWPEPGDLKPVVESDEVQEGYRLLKVSYEVEDGDRVPALLLIPDRATPASPAPAIAVWHQHNGEYHLGKSEPAGLAGNSMHHTGVALAKEGYVVLCPDALCFEDRQDATGKLKGGQFERFEFLRYLVAGKCMAWKNILDMRRAIDYLVSRPEVRAQRLGCYGHSMGSTHTYMLGPWEPRLKCLVGNCCMPTYDAIHRTHILHCFPNFVPGIHQYGDTPDIVSLIAPAALHMNFGELDSGSPIEEVRAGVQHIGQAYEAAGVGERFSYFIESDTGHVLSDAMWTRTRDHFARWLA